MIVLLFFVPLVCGFHQFRGVSVTSRPYIDFGYGDGGAQWVQELVDVGANLVKLYAVRHVRNAAAPAAGLYAINDTDNPLRGPSDSELVGAMGRVLEAGATLALAPVVEPDFTDPRWNCAPMGGGGGCMNRASVGAAWFPDGPHWPLFFDQFEAFAVHCANLTSAAAAAATAAPPSSSLSSVIFDVSAGMDHFSVSAPEDLWRRLIRNVRAALPPGAQLMATLASVGSGTVPRWFDDLDVVAFSSDALRVDAANASVAAQRAAWAEFALPRARQLSQLAGKKPWLVDLRIQSRPSCYRAPPSSLLGGGIPRRDQGDCSGWLECYDPQCQANAYEALFQATAAASSVPAVEGGPLAGLLVWHLPADQTVGGLSDSTFSPRGKPAVAVLNRWWAGAANATTMDSSMQLIERALAARSQQQQQQQQQQQVAAASQQKTPWVPPPTSFNHSRFRNGFVFGGPDEWSAPTIRFGSAPARRSLQALRRTGANAVELPVMWFYTNANSTRMAPITDRASALRTTTDEELAAVIGDALQLGFEHVCVTPMLDPDYDLPGHCRQCPGPPGPGWRGLIGQWFGTDCGAGSRWAQWHANYRRFIVHYAALAQAAGATEFLVTHELQAATQQCPALWTALVHAVRGVFRGRVGAAFNAPVAQYVDAVRRWAGVPGALDYAGVDAYFPEDVTLPAGAAPWFLAPAGAVEASWAPFVKQLHTVATRLQLPVVATEVGFQSRPYAFSGTLNGLTVHGRNHQLSPNDCSIASPLCAVESAQSLAISSMFSVLYREPWFQGFYLWMWRADPTAGGGADDSFSVNGKLSYPMLSKWWGGHQI